LPAFWEWLIRDKSFLLEMTALAELTKPHPNSGFLKWLSANATDEGFIAAPSIGEIESGVAMLRVKQKQRRLETWVEALTREYADHILPFDGECARVWGHRVRARPARRDAQSSPCRRSITSACSIPGIKG
jgi:predicted nucleic acid-binding protein